MACLCVLAGCLADDRPSDAQPYHRADPRTLLNHPAQDEDLALEVWHRVISPTEIRGVILVHHRGAEAVSLADRETGWGSAQWCFIIDGHEIVPDWRQDWERFFYSCTVLGDHETRAVAFALRDTAIANPASWQFAPFADTIVRDGPEGHYRPTHQPPFAFTATTTVQLILDASQPVPPPPDSKPTTVRPYGGQLCATSRLLGDAEPEDGPLSGPKGPYPHLR